MQVLVKNPFTPVLSLPGTIASFWSPECLYMDHDFSFGRTMELSSALKLSPFLALDPKIAFLISNADKKVSLCRGIGILGAIGLHFMTGENVITSDNDIKRETRYVNEYLPHNPLITAGKFEQVVVYGNHQIDRSLWDLLPVNGTYIMGFMNRELDTSNVHFEAFGKLWPYGEANEFGWQFEEENWGLSGFKFYKFRKLS